MVGKKRLTEKFHQPSEEFIQIFMGDDAWKVKSQLWCKLPRSAMCQLLLVLCPNASYLWRANG
jgi:hypothetical protein